MNNLAICVFLGTSSRHWSQFAYSNCRRWPPSKTHLSPEQRPRLSHRPFELCICLSCGQAVAKHQLGSPRFIQITLIYHWDWGETGVRLHFPSPDQINMHAFERTEEELLPNGAIRIDLDTSDRHGHARNPVCFAFVGKPNPVRHLFAHLQYQSRDSWRLSSPCFMDWILFGSRLEKNNKRK